MLGPIGGCVLSLAGRATPLSTCGGQGKRSKWLSGQEQPQQQRCMVPPGWGWGHCRSDRRVQPGPGGALVGDKSRPCHQPVSALQLLLHSVLSLKLKLMLEFVV